MHVLSRFNGSDIIILRFDTKRLSVRMIAIC